MNLKGYTIVKLSKPLAGALMLASMCLVANGQGKLADIKKDLTASNAKLTTQRAKLSQERLTLSSELTAQQNEIATKRRQVRLARMSVADRAEVMRQLEFKASNQQQEKSFLQNQLSNYTGKLAASLAKGEKINLPEGDEFSEQMLVLEAGLSRLEKVIGGAVLEAEGADAEGVVKPGKLAMMGPLLWFQADDKSFQGEAVLSKGGRLAKVIGESDESAVAGLFSGEEVSIPVDLTGGEALALASIDQSPLDLFRKGGTWVWPIMGVALVALICALIKFAQLSKIKNPDVGWLSGVLENLRSGDAASVDEAIESCGKISHPVGAVMAESLTGYAHGADMVEDMIYERMIEVRERLRKWLPFIAVTAAIAPLLGLLGTVSGMIGTFNVIAVVGTGDPKPMAGGISEALVTTFFGLVVAIPALVLHSLLSRRSQGIMQTTEKLGLRMVNSIRKETKES